MHRAGNLARLAAALAHVRPRTVDPTYLKDMAKNASALAAGRILDAPAVLLGAPVERAGLPDGGLRLWVRLPLAAASRSPPRLPPNAVR
ncbi:MAG: hypothetical protein WDN24_01785 [Sphingomonas sp.]